MGNKEMNRIPRYGWPSAGLIIAIYVVSEVMAALYVRSGDMLTDWSFVYVSVKFAIIPLLCAIHIFYNVYRLIRPRQIEAKARVLTFMSVAVPIIYTISLWTYPLPIFVRIP